MRRRHKNHAVTAMTRPRPGHDGHGHGHGHDGHRHDGHARRTQTRHGHDHAQSHHPQSRHTKERARAIPHDTPKHNRTNVPTLHHATNTPVGECPPGAKSKAAGSLVLTLNARWNIFGLPVTHEVFTYLVAATVAAPYILCIMFLGLMLMAVEQLKPYQRLAVHSHAVCEDSRCGTVSSPTGLSRAWPIWTRTYYFGLVCNPVGTAFWLPGSIPGVCSRFHGVAAYEIDGIARISPLEHVGDKRLPALIRWLMTEGEARPNGCIDVSRSLPLVVKPIPPCRTSCRLGR